MNVRITVAVVCGTVGVGVAVAAGLVRYADWESASWVVTVIGLPSALVAAALAVLSALREGRKDVSRPLEAGAVADQLALAVQSQWEGSERPSHLPEQDPLPLSWRGAGDAVFEPWSDLVSTAAEWPRAYLSDPSGWATGPGDLDGSGSAIADVLLHKVPTRRLVVLGEPGSGKTALLVGLVLELLSRRRPGDPVPVLVPIASWIPSGQDFEPWLESRLVTDFPALGERVGSGGRGLSHLQVLLRTRKLVLVLDGLDELTEPVRGLAVRKLERFLSPGQAVVLSSRYDEYRHGVSVLPGGHVVFRAAAGIVVREQSIEEVARYLRRNSPTRAAASRWAPVLAVLGLDDAVTETLRTPLMVHLAQTVFSPRDEEPLDAVPDPVILCDRDRFPDSVSLRAFLFDSFVTASYRTDRSGKVWSVGDAAQYFRFLASHLEGRLRGSVDITWWELRHAVPRPLIGVTAGVLAAVPAGLVAGLGGERLGVGVGAGLLAGSVVAVLTRVRTRTESLSGSLASGALSGTLGGLLGGALVAAVTGSTGLPTNGLVGGVEVGLAVSPLGRTRGSVAGGLIGGLVVGLLAGHGSGLPAGIVTAAGVAVVVGLTVELEGRREPAKGLAGLHWSSAGLTAGVAVGLATGLSVGLGARIGLFAGCVTGVLAGLATALVAGLEGSRTDMTQATSPRELLRQDGLTFLGTGLATAVALGLATGAGIRPSVGAAAGFGFGLTVAFLQSASGPYVVSHCWLALHRRLPWTLIPFLADAHTDKSVLRQVGGVYQFRHVDLQRRLGAHRPDDDL